ncbi:hypothetical protein ONS95_014532 [Cadophora gregata]|uniref:uncharacterized protein n=1 Tax=Cadophora gregata TaxID=51156 RepID=UPI0026DA93A3|nr:uncharacterized protein ONS95_014532 [Cadophora gregata]KAK0112800.1 hypothetical protein ONS95_014532 [Cadophora gregata]
MPFHSPFSVLQDTEQNSTEVRTRVAQPKPLTMVSPVNHLTRYAKIRGKRDKENCRHNRVVLIQFASVELQLQNQFISSSRRPIFLLHTCNASHSNKDPTTPPHTIHPSTTKIFLLFSQNPSKKEPSTLKKKLNFISNPPTPPPN